MVNEDLIENIKARFQQGEKTSDVREALINEGWSEGDIDAAFASIRHDALMHIPIYAKIHHWMESIDHKTSELPTKTLVLIFSAIALLFLGGVFLLYYFLDPLGVRSGERDAQREEMAITLRKSLDQYYKDNNKYPSKVSELAPKYLATEPLDPKRKTSYDYKVFDNNRNYEFCMQFELQALLCISSDNTSDIPLAESVSVQQPQPTQPVQYAINGQIFTDMNKDGEKAEEEQVFEGTDVKIADGESNIICATSTDSSGIFNCNVVGEGTYTVSFESPPGYANPGGNPVIVTLPSDTALPNVATLFIGLVK